MIVAGMFAFYGIVFILPEKEEKIFEFSGQLPIASLSNYDSDVCFNMDGKEIHIRDPKITLLDAEKFQEELSAHQNFRLETTKVRKNGWEYYIVRYMEDEEGNVLISYYSSGKAGMILALGGATVIFVMALILAVADRKIIKEERPEIHMLFWRD